MHVPCAATLPRSSITHRKLAPVKRESSRLISHAHTIVSRVLAKLEPSDGRAGKLWDRREKRSKERLDPTLLSSPEVTRSLARPLRVEK